MPLSVSFTVWALVAFLALFFGAGAYAMVRAMIEARENVASGKAARGLSERVRDYVGPVSPDMARLNPPLRVFLEFCCALFGFPGLGWALSARFVVGLGLMLCGPIVAWFVMPVALYYSGALRHDVYLLAIDLPFWAVGSALSLAVVEVRARRRGHVVVG